MRLFLSKLICPSCSLKLHFVDYKAVFRLVYPLVSSRNVPDSRLLFVCSDVRCGFMRSGVLLNESEVCWI